MGQRIVLLAFNKKNHSLNNYFDFGNVD